MTTAAVGQATEAQSLLELERARIIGSIFSNSLPDLSDQRLRFVPRDALRQAISHEVVKNILRYIPETGRKQEQNLSTAVADGITPADCCRCGQARCTGGRIIFVALLALPKESLIASLFGQSATRICDADLPRLSLEVANRSRQIADTSSKLLEAFADLSNQELDRFNHFTWQLRSPFIKGFDSKESNTASPDAIVEFESSVSLPWIYLGDGQEDATDDAEEEAVGGVEEGAADNAEEASEEDAIEEVTRVQKVTIHPAHHDPNRLAAELALKTFLERRLARIVEAKYTHEVKANHKTRQHAHIVPLLAAFKHRERFHLLLPWAHGGNLRDLFRKYATSETLLGRHQRIAKWYSETWLFAQCFGIADGLATVHDTNQSEQYSLTSPQIHADIKPENILCFASDDRKVGPFTLKLADFGEAQEVNSRTKEVEVDIVTHTKTYRPPEYDTDDYLNLNYDVWCLGCVYLELITWAISGSQALDDFDNVRLDECDDKRVTIAKGNVQADTFFKKVAEPAGRMFSPGIKVGHKSRIRVGSKSFKKTSRKRHEWWLEHKGSNVKAEVKDGVRKHIQALLKGCSSNNVRRFLDFIDTSMLVVDPQLRASSDKNCKSSTFINGKLEIEIWVKRRGSFNIEI